MIRILRWLLVLASCSITLGCAPQSGLPVLKVTPSAVTRENAAATQQPTPQEKATPVVVSPTKVRTPFSVESMVEYVDPNGFFRMTYPGGWHEFPLNGETQFWADYMASAGLAVAIQVNSVSAGALADAFSAWQKNTLLNYVEIQRSEIEINGYPATVVTRRWTEGGVTDQGMFVSLVRDRVGLLLQAWAPEESWPDIEPAALAAMKSIQFTEYAVAPSYDTWYKYTGANLTLYYLPDTWMASTIQDIAAQHEAAYLAIRQALKLVQTKPITFYLYPTAEVLYRATARNAGFAIEGAGEVHALWVAKDDHETTGHELTHVLTANEWGHPTEALLGEGIAVCLDQSGNDPHAQAAALLKQGTLVALADMLGDSWYNIDTSISYPESGSFSWFLLQTFGADAFRRLYQASDLKTTLVEVTGNDLGQLETAWKQMLAKYN